MRELVHARVHDRLVKMRLGQVALRLDALLSEAARDDRSYIDFLDRLLAEELEAKQRKRVTMGLQIAHFPEVKTLEGFDFTLQPGVDATLVRELATGRFVAHGENVVLIGPPGVGKTHLAVALGRSAVEAGYSVLFLTATALVGALAKAEAEGTLTEKLAYFGKPKLLIVDELGYLPFERRSAHLVYQLVARRYGRGSTMLTTNRSVVEWGTLFGDDMTAAAILDRLLHRSHTMTIQGDSYRLREKRRAGLLSPAVGAHPTL